MKEIVQIVVAIAAVAFFVWMLLGSKSEASGDAFIDPSDPRQIGTLTGMLGGDVVDAVIVNAVLRQFERAHGRKATVKDMGIVAGMLRNMR
jgi:hypothetical protein